MNMPLVSILSPTYNHQKYIEQCIASVQMQSYPDWEMIILNDGSTDGTQAVAEKMALKDPRIHVINQANVGVFRLAETYNKGLHLAKGKYIAILEGDDLWNQDKLSTQVEIMEKDPSIVLTWGKAELINADNTQSYYVSPEPKNIPTDLFNNIPAGSIIELSLFNAWLPALTIVIRKADLLDIGGFQSRGMPLVDFPTILALSLRGKFFFQNNVLGKWRIYPTQTTKKYTVEIYRGMLNFLREHLSKVYTEFDPAKKKIIDHYNQLCLVAYARSGRYKLIRKEYKSARQDYVKAIGYPANGKMVWRLRALVGYAMSLFHMDVEWIAKILGKKTYKGADK